MRPAAELRIGDLIRWRPSEPWQRITSIEPWGDCLRVRAGDPACWSDMVAHPVLCLVEVRP